MSRSTLVGLRTTGTVLLLVIASMPIVGQNTEATDQQTISQLAQQIKALQQRDHELEERIKLLEANQKTATPETSTSETSQQATATTATATPVTEASAPQETQTAAIPLPEMHNFRSIQWRGFGELDYKVLDQRTPELGTYGFVSGSAGNFYTGDFDLFLNSRLNDKTSILAELDFEEGDAQKFKLDLRRMLLKYDVNDHLRFSFGRYQTDIGYYNWAFRSASWLQTTADRPLIMEYATNGGLLPTQAVGISATGSIPSGKLGLNYVAEYGSADTIRPDINGDGFVNDENNATTSTSGFFSRPIACPGCVSVVLSITIRSAI